MESDDHQSPSLTLYTPSRLAWTDRSTQVQSVVPCIRICGHSIPGILVTVTSRYRVGIAAMVSWRAAQQRDPQCPLCAGSDFSDVISIGAACLNRRLPRKAGLFRRYASSSSSDAAFIRGWIVSSVKTDFATGPNKALDATQPSECTRRCATSAVWNDRGKSLSTNSFAYPKTGDQLPPSELKATKAEDKGALLAANWSSSTATSGPSTITTFGRSGVPGRTEIVAARAGVAASRIDAIVTQRRIHSRYS